MKRLLILCTLAAMLAAAPAMAEELKAGQQASAWSFPDADGKQFTMETWAGKVLSISYVDPDESDLNEHFTDALKKAKDEGHLSEEHYKGFGIVDLDSTRMPNFLIKALADRKAKKYKTTILFDTDAILRNAWGLAKDTSNVIILDKNRVCQAIVRGRVPDDQVETLVQLVVDLQSK